MICIVDIDGPKRPQAVEFAYNCLEVVPGEHDTHFPPPIEPAPTVVHSFNADVLLVWYPGGDMMAGEQDVAPDTE